MAATSYPPLPLPAGVTESYVKTDDLTYHILEAGYHTGSRKPLILLIHGAPELAFSWRKIILPLAACGYHVVAYDQRGYGRTTGWDTRPYAEVDLKAFASSRVVTDAIRLMFALGHKEAQCVVGHDFGAVGASWCALTRPDIFRSLVMMSHPFTGIPNLPFDIVQNLTESKLDAEDVHKDLAQLHPPRKHYKWYYSTEAANHEMMKPKDNLHAFFKGYYYLKSADWSKNNPRPLAAWSASELAKLPYYYVMPLNSSMPETVAEEMSIEDSASVIKKMARWLPDQDIEVYVSEYNRTTFQGCLNYYRVGTDPAKRKDLELFAGKRIDVPCLFVAGKQDWGTYQEPGAVQKLVEICSDFRGVKLVTGAGHWVQQEQPEEVVRLIKEFLACGEA